MATRTVETPTPAGVATKRLLSLDAFRGLTVASMVLVNNPGGEPVYQQLDHAAWSGWTFTDTIFPSFLWMVGVALTLSTANRVERGESRSQLVLHAVRRGVLLYLFGLFLAGFPYFHLATIRLPGVLPRIAVCYVIAALVFLYTNWRVQIAVTIGLFVTYWLLMFYGPLPCVTTDRFSESCNFARMIDGLVLSGHMWSHTRVWDPEGLISTLPAIGSTLLGVITGHLLRLRLSANRTAIWLIVQGAALFILGNILDIWMPINKSLWTVSYAVLMAGVSSLAFGVFYWVMEVRGWKRWAQPLVIYGSNAITVFVASGIMGRLLGLLKVMGADGKPESLGGYLYVTYTAPLGSPINASLLWALAMVTLFFLISWVLYSRRWFLKL